MDETCILKVAESLLKDYQNEKAVCNKQRAINSLTPYFKYFEKIVDAALSTYDEAKSKDELKYWIDAFNY